VNPFFAIYAKTGRQPLAVEEAVWFARIVSVCSLGNAMQGDHGGHGFF
jgi:hypothetical protein